jgi:Fe-S cluster biogenesis protein NfuA
MQMPDATDQQMTIPERIEGALESIRPALHIDGGDVEFVDFDQADGIVHIRLMGACGGCPISSVTVKHGIERRIRAAVPEVTGVAVVGA